MAYSDKEEQILPFPQKLYLMLESVDRLGLSHTVSWSSNGRSFQVKDPIEFMELTIPRFFKATKFRSFQRQLNLWGFQRITKGQHVWCHPTFIRGCPEKLHGIYRTKVKGNVRVNKDKQASTSTDLMDSSSLSADVLDTSFGYDAFDEKVKALFSVQEIPPIDYDDDGGSSMFQPRVSDDESEEPDGITLTETCNSWDDMSIEIEPLPMNCFKVLGSETQTQNANLDDFQQFLSRLIK